MGAVQSGAWCYAMVYGNLAVGSNQRPYRIGAATLSVFVASQREHIAEKVVLSGTTICCHFVSPPLFVACVPSGIEGYRVDERLVPLLIHISGPQALIACRASALGLHEEHQYVSRPDRTVTSLNVLEGPEDSVSKRGI